MRVQISPRGSLDQLSQIEVARLQANAESSLYQLYRSCSLAVLASGLNIDDCEALFSAHTDFEIKVLPRQRGIKLELHNPPSEALVDGILIRGLQEHLFSVLRDILYLSDLTTQGFCHRTSDAITNGVFDLLRNAQAIHHQDDPNLIVCWGGHSIKPNEFDYCYQVGYQLGLRDLDICTGCGPGAMEGPMQGAAVAHAKQRNQHSRFIGLTEPSIIAAEPPNPIVNQLVILPDIEKRLEAFVRLGHGIVIFPGGAGTTEELLYLLGIKLSLENQGHPLPLVLTGPKSSEGYFDAIDQFLVATLGPQIRTHYRVIIDDSAQVARYLKSQMPFIRQYRKEKGDSYHFNWSLHIPIALQQPFEPTHQAMAQLPLCNQQPTAVKLAHLRQLFSGIVAGNVKPKTVMAVRDQGPFQLSGDPQLIEQIDKLLCAFANQGRMKLPGTHYEPCYTVDLT